MNILKGQINAQQTKESQPVYRSKDFRAVKKNYEDAVRLIHQKDEEVIGANQLLSEK